MNSRKSMMIGASVLSVIALTGFAVAPSVIGRLYTRQLHIISRRLS